MPRFRRPPATPEQEAPAAEAYATNKLGSFPAVEAVAPRFRVSADNNVLVYANRHWLIPAVGNAVALLLLFVPGLEPMEGLLPRMFLLLLLGVLPWLLYHHTVVVLNAAADDAQFLQKTVRGTTRVRVPLDMLQTVKVESSGQGSKSNLTRAVLNFGQQQMPLSNAFTLGSAPANDAAVIREWLAFHHLQP